MAVSTPVSADSLWVRIADLGSIKHYSPTLAEVILRDGTPLRDLYFGEPYGNAPGGDVSQVGVMNFGGGGSQDIFRAVRCPDGARQWQYSSDSRGNWTSLNDASVEPADLRFGDFNGDGKADLFVASPRVNGGWQWRYEPTGNDTTV